MRDPTADQIRETSSGANRGFTTQIESVNDSSQAKSEKQRVSHPTYILGSVEPLNPTSAPSHSRIEESTSCRMSTGYDTKGTT